MDSIKTSKLINPQTIGGLISPVSSVDANSYTVSGIHYLTTGCSHVPENYVYLIVNATSKISVSQIAIAYSSQKVYCRSLSSGSWSAWTEISFHSHSHAWSEITDKPSSFPPESHSHAWSEITGKPSSFPPATHSHAWSEITGKPSSFTPSSHTHTWSEVTGKPDTIRDIVLTTTDPTAGASVSYPNGTIIAVYE